QEPCRTELSAITAEPSWRSPRPSTPSGSSCGILQQCRWGDAMAEASVLAAPRAQLADNSRKAIWAAAMGNLLEWYDFGVYAYLAGLIAAKFFPNSDPTASLLATFAAYGVGFLARPLGGILIGRLGDRKGRKAALVLTIFLMAFGTVGLGLLPSYEAIGV